MLFLSYSIKEITATAGADFSGVPGSGEAVIRPGETFTGISVEIIDDVISGEGNETLSIAVSTSDNVTTFTEVDVNITILDNGMNISTEIFFGLICSCLNWTGITAATIISSLKSSLFFLSFRVKTSSPNWPACSKLCVFIAQLMEHCSANAEAMGLNPVQVPILFSG